MVLARWRCRYVDEGLRDLTGYPTQMLRLPHSLMSDADKRVYAAQYAGTQELVSANGWSADDEEQARRALTVRLRSVARARRRCAVRVCTTMLARSPATSSTTQVAAQGGLHARVLPQLHGPEAQVGG